MTVLILDFVAPLSGTLIFVSLWPGSVLLLSDGRRPEAGERLPVGLWAGALGRGGAAGSRRAQELEAAAGEGRGLLRHGQVHQTGNYNTREGNYNTREGNYNTREGNYNTGG